MNPLLLILAVLMVGCSSVEPSFLSTSTECSGDCVPEDTNIQYGGKCDKAEDSIIIFDGDNVREECYPTFPQADLPIHIGTCFEKFGCVR